MPSSLNPHHLRTNRTPKEFYFISVRQYYVVEAYEILDAIDMMDKHVGRDCYAWYPERFVLEDRDHEKKTTRLPLQEDLFL